MQIFSVKLVICRIQDPKCYSHHQYILRQVADQSVEILRPSQLVRLFFLGKLQIKNKREERSKEKNKDTNKDNSRDKNKDKNKSKIKSKNKDENKDKNKDKNTIHFITFQYNPLHLTLFIQFYFITCITKSWMISFNVFTSFQDFISNFIQFGYMAGKPWNFPIIQYQNTPVKRMSLVKKQGIITAEKGRGSKVLLKLKSEGDLDSDCQSNKHQK